MLEAETFVREVRSYCDFIEQAADVPLDQRLARARRRLLALYQAALELPRGSPEDSEDGVELPRAARPNEWCGFGDKDFYWEVFDPYVDEESVAFSVSEDVLDVYTDVREGLAYWDAGRCGEAVWRWRFSFESHWGDHAVDALRVLHRACAWNA